MKFYEENEAHNLCLTSHVTSNSLMRNLTNKWSSLNYQANVDENESKEIK